MVSWDSGYSKAKLLHAGALGLRSVALKKNGDHYEVWVRGSSDDGATWPTTGILAPVQLPDNLAISADSKSISLTWDAMTGLMIISNGIDYNYSSRDGRNWTPYPQV